MKIIEFGLYEIQEIEQNLIKGGCIIDACGAHACGVDSCSINLCGANACVTNVVGGCVIDVGVLADASMLIPLPAENPEQPRYGEPRLISTERSIVTLVNP